jgi:chitin disaccharide deacetylase
VRSADTIANARRWLIVNADDFGLSEGVNRGIIRAHQEGILTSASLMVRWPAAAEAARYAVAHTRLSVGLHLDLAEWVYRDGQWVARYEVVPSDDAAAVAKEVSNQLEAFHHVLGRPPTHVDSHQHVHRNEPVRSIVTRVTRELGVPLRSFASAVRYCGDFYGQTGEGEPYPEGISLEGLLKTLGNLPTGVTELGCHPGEDDDLHSIYRVERRQEMMVLCLPQVRAALDSLGIQLTSFSDLPELVRKGAGLGTVDQGGVVCAAAVGDSRAPDAPPAEPQGGDRT